MVNKLTKPGKAYAFKYVLIQLVLILLSCMLWYMVSGPKSALSALAAGAIVVIPTAVFSFKAFQYAGASAAKHVVESFNKGIKLKMLLTAILFALSFKYLDINPGAFFITFSLTMVAPWLTALVNNFYFNQQ